MTVGLDVGQILYMESDRRIIGMVCQHETIEFYGKIGIVEKEINYKTPKDTNGVLWEKY